VKARFVSEALDFEREGTPYEKLRIGKNRFNLKPYPKESVENFMDWYDKEIEPYYSEEEEFEMMLDSIQNDELSSDEELIAHWKSIGADPEFANKLILARDYLLDFGYTKNLG